jgi:hypothetical protein
MRTFESWEKVSEASGKGASPLSEEHVPDDSDDAVISIGSSAHHQPVWSVVLTDY